MVEAIQYEGGIVDKFMGDAVMAIFQAKIVSSEASEQPCDQRD